LPADPAFPPTEPPMPPLPLGRSGALLGQAMNKTRLALVAVRYDGRHHRL